METKNRLQQVLNVIARPFSSLKNIALRATTLSTTLAGSLRRRCCNQDNGLNFKILRWWNKNVNKKTYYYKIKKYLPIKNYYVMWTQKEIYNETISFDMNVKLIALIRNLFSDSEKWKEYGSIISLGDDFVYFKLLNSTYVLYKHDFVFDGAVKNRYLIDKECRILNKMTKIYDIVSFENKITLECTYTNGKIDVGVVNNNDSITPSFECNNDIEGAFNMLLLKLI